MNAVDSAALELAARVDRDRLLRTTMSLLELPSPSGHERPVAERYAALLEENGLEVRFHGEFSDSPNVIGQLSAGSARSLQFDGHTDTVAQPHAPPRYDKGEISGRGAADMKAGLAAMAEAARILGQVRQQLGGALLVTAHGQHEDPVAPHELHAPMFALFRDRVLGDAAIIAEGPAHEMVIAGKGLCVFDLSFVRDGEPVHEVMWADRVPNPIMGVHAFLGKVERRAAEWRTRPDPLLGPETYFVGVVEGGDYFNRIPTRCRIQGSRRYPSERTFQDVHAELQGLVREVEVETGLRGELRTMPSGQGFRVDPDQRIVQSVRHAYRQVVGGEQPLVGMALIGNASQFNTLAGIPTVYHGVDQTTAHSGFEHVALDDVERTAKVLVVAAVDYLGLEIGA